MTYIINGKTFPVKKTGNRFYYYSMFSGRWLPVAKREVVFLPEAGNA